MNKLIEDFNPPKFRPVQNLNNREQPLEEPSTINILSDFVWVESFFTIEEEEETLQGATFEVINKRPAACTREGNQNVWAWSAVRIDKPTELFGG